MKRHILYIMPLAFTMFGMTSCLDFDDPGTELTATEEAGSGSEAENREDTTKTKISEDGVITVAANTIKYKECAQTEDELNEALSAMSNNLSQCLGSEYSLRGGKEQGYPGSHAYQRQYCLGPDNYAQYSTIPHHDFMYGEQTSTYYLSVDFNGGPAYAYSMAKSGFVQVLNHTYIDKVPELKAVMLLMHDIAAQENVDLYGAMTYADNLKNKQESPYEYNKMEHIYTTIISNIDSVIACFKYYDNRPSWYKRSVQQALFKYTKITNDEENGVEGFDTWIRMANCLKLRMAMHVVKLDAATAQKWAEEAVDPNNGGVIETYEQEISLRPMALGFTNPLLEISHTWGDTRLSASFCSLLQSLDHPYLGYLFKKNSNIIHNTKTGGSWAKDYDYVGIREGAHTGAGQAYAGNEYIAYSEIDNSLDQTQLAPLYIFKLSEIEFLRAEGALRGWNMGGSAQYWYEQGIRDADFCDRIMKDDSPYMAAVSEYMQRTSPKNYTWTDPIGQDEDMPSVTKIGVAWNDGDSQETKLEKIITQKYISLWPNSWEAWGDMRRTGYPKVFPVLNPQDGDGSLQYGDLIRRIPWYKQEAADQADVASTGLKALGGADQQGTRIWWDVKGKGNF